MSVVLLCSSNNLVFYAQSTIAVISRRLLLCFLYLFVEFIITMYE